MKQGMSVLFIFKYVEDLDTLIWSFVDEQGLNVNAMLLV